MCFLTDVGHGYCIACPYGITLSNIICHVREPVVSLLTSEIKRSHLNKGSGAIDAISLTLTFLLALICASSLRVGERRLTREASEGGRGATVRRVFVVVLLGNVVVLVVASQRSQTAEPQTLPSLPNQTGAGAARAGLLSLW